MNRYPKIGDRVVCIKKYQEGLDGPVLPGETGTFIYYYTNGNPDYGIEWDTEKDSRHDCHRKCKNKYGYYVPRNHIKREKDVPQEIINKWRLIYQILV